MNTIPESSGTAREDRQASEVAATILRTLLKCFRHGQGTRPTVLLPAGIIANDMGLYASERFKVKGTVSYDHSGPYAALASFRSNGR